MTGYVIWLKKVDAYRKKEAQNCFIYGPLCCPPALKSAQEQLREFFLAKYRSKLQLFDLGLTENWKVCNQKMLFEYIVTQLNAKENHPNIKVLKVRNRFNHTYY